MLSSKFIDVHMAILAKGSSYVMLLNGKLVPGI